MNEFLEQFLIEAKELVTQATDDLLALESRPDDQDQLDSAFRAFHTLKGAAGIIEFAPMGRALHAAEDLLSRARTSEVRLDPSRIGECLTVLDQVVQWLDVIEGTGELPEHAGPEADVIVARFVHAAPSPAPAPGAQQRLQNPDDQWVAKLFAGDSARPAHRQVAVRWRPDSACFFDGGDPLAAVAALPGLMALDISPCKAWPPLEEIDPFACQIEITALAAATLGQARLAFGEAADQVEFLELDGSDQTLPQPARDIIQAQIELLEAPPDSGSAGRLRSAGRVAVNVLRSLGQDQQATSLTKVLGERPDGPALAVALRRLLGTGSPAGPSAQPQLRAETAARSLRVDVDRIDALVRLTGELTVIKNGLDHVAGLAEAGVTPAALGAALRDQQALLGRLVDDLQHSVLSIRVLPLRHVFQRFPRLIRDLSVSLDKPVRLVIAGEATEADKAIVEGLFDPLLHVLRNAVDHGVETATARQAAGKDPQAVIHLRAARQGEHVLVEIEDDGRGIDLDRVRETALKRGVASAEALAAMTPAQTAELVFAPGFSTAKAVSDLSGRGVGMDAARAAVAQMGGRVQLESRPGHGTLVRFVLPFTVMMTRVMTVEAAGQAFGLALDTVVETLKVARDDISTIGSAAAFVHRERTIPLIDLGRALGAGHGPLDKPDATVVVASVAGQRVGLEVDRLGGRMDVMLKPMEGLLAGMAGVAGTTLLGDGRVMLVLELGELLS